MRIIQKNASAVSKVSRRNLHTSSVRPADLISNSEIWKCGMPAESLAHRNGLHRRGPRCYGSVTVWNGFQDRVSHNRVSSRYFTSELRSSKPVFTTKKDSVGQQQEETHRIITATEQELDELLTSASIRAREISALAVKKVNRPPANATTKSTLDKNAGASQSPSVRKEAQNAIEAADALLALTSHTNFKRALDEKREKQQQKVENSRDKTLYLHSAFITVISWLCSVLSSLPQPALNQRDNHTAMLHNNFEMGASEQNFILAKILDLMSRSTDLKLPLHLPLYRRIASLLAQYNTTSDTSLLILDLSSQAHLALSVSHEIPSPNPVLTAEFFSEPLKILARSNQTQQIIDVIEGMNSLHQLERIDNETSYELLMILSQRLTEMRKDVKNNPSLILKENYQSGIFNITHLTSMLEAYLSEQISGDDYDNETDLHFDDLDLNELDEVDKTSNLTPNLIKNADIDEETKDKESQLPQIAKGEYSAQSKEISTLSLDEKVERILKGEKDDQLVNSIKKEADAIIKSIRAKRNSGKHSSLDKQSQQSNSVDAIVTARVHVDPVTGNVENVEIACDPKSSSQSDDFSHEIKSRNDSLERKHQSMAKELIYLRNSEAWDLPDITKQLEKWNNDNDILFTKEYEETLLNEYMSYDDDNDTEAGIWNNLDYFDDDDDDFDDDDIDDDGSFS